jgi:amino acid adenylation domain-containing protein
MGDQENTLSSSSAAKRALLERWRRGEAVVAATATIQKRAGTDELPLAASQRGMWLAEHARASASTPLFNQTQGARIVGLLDTDALREALAGVVSRYEACRMRVVVHEGIARWQIADAVPVPLSVRDFSADGDAAEALAKAFEDAEAKRPFALDEAPLIRFFALKIRHDLHHLVIVGHHLILDGWGFEVVLNDLNKLYSAARRGIVANLEPLAIDYGDYLVWSAAEAERRRAERGAALAEWKAWLDDAPAVVTLPPDRSRPAELSDAGADHAFELPPGVFDAVSRIAVAHGTSALVVFLAAFYVLLARFTGKRDLVVGSPRAGRDLAETHTVLGMFVNAVVHRASVPPTISFAELIGAVARNVAWVDEHAEVPFDELVAHLGTERTLSHHPVFQVMFAYQTFRNWRVGFEGTTETRLSLHSGTAKYDLLFQIERRSEALVGWIEYKSELYSASTIARLGEAYVELLELALQSPERAVGGIPLCKQDELVLLEKWAVSPHAPAKIGEADDLTVHSIFERKVRETPDTVALYVAGKYFALGELNERANQVAHHLLALGVARGERVGLLGDRTLDMVVGLLGILKSGAAYVPIDTRFPLGRVTKILGNAKARRMLVGCESPFDVPGVEQVGPCSDELLARYPKTNPDVAVHEGQLACIAYTSGSTGEPKGVMEDHREVRRAMEGAMSALPLHGERVLGFSTIAFDVHIMDIFSCLYSGGTVFIAPLEALYDPAVLIRELETHDITFFEATPSTWSMLIDAGWKGKANLKATVGSQAVSGRLVNELLPRMQELYHLYGVTEAVVWQTARRVEHRDPGNLAEFERIGPPFSHIQQRVLDANCQPVPIGVVGEIYFGGDALARGYLDDPVLTADRFIPDPFRKGGARLYRTGDLGRYLPDGTIAFLGRSDLQVKVRGFRVEIPEVEAAVRSIAGVRDAIVVARPARVGTGSELAGYVTVDACVGIDAHEVKQRLRSLVPDYMVPLTIAVLEALPLNANGKIDWRALPGPEVEARGPRLRPQDPIEIAVADVWRSVLGCGEVCADDNFFLLGGNSMLVPKVVVLLTGRGFQLGVADIFRCGTVAELAQRLRTSGADRIRDAREEARRRANARARSGRGGSRQ